MDRTSVKIGERLVPFLSWTTSWHPTFEVLYLDDERSATLPVEDVARALSPYGNVYSLRLRDLAPASRGAARELAELILEWTRRTGVRRPVLLVPPGARPAGSAFAAAYPQFAHALIELTAVRGSVAAGPFELVWKLVAAPLRALRTVAPDLPGTQPEEVAVPRFEIPPIDDAREVAAHVRRVVASIKVTAPGQARRPSRPWAAGPDGSQPEDGPSTLRM